MLDFIITSYKVTINIREAISLLPFPQILRQTQHGFRFFTTNMGTHNKLLHDIGSMFAFSCSLLALTINGRDNSKLQNVLFILLLNACFYVEISFNS